MAGHSGFELRNYLARPSGRDQDRRTQRPYLLGIRAGFPGGGKVGQGVAKPVLRRARPRALQALSSRRRVAFRDTGGAIQCLVVPEESRSEEQQLPETGFIVPLRNLIVEVRQRD